LQCFKLMMLMMLMRLAVIVVSISCDWVATSAEPALQIPCCAWSWGPETPPSFQASWKKLDGFATPTSKHVGRSRQGISNLKAVRCISRHVGLKIV
jgi:hypothetical protein